MNMKKLFKTVDSKFAEIGFKNMIEDHHGARYARKVDGARYARKVDESNYIQCLDLLCKHNGRHLIQSYEEEVNDDGYNNVIGLSMYEAKLCLKKMKQMGWKVVKN